MAAHARKVFTLFKKDLKDTMKNFNVTILLLLPLLFAVLYRFMDFGGEHMPGNFVLLMSVLMNVCMVPTSFLAMIIAEEKEKNTLRTLMLSNVTGGEFLLSKSLVTFLYMQLVNILVFFITEQPAKDLPWFLLVLTLSSVCMILVGAVSGIVSRDQMSTSIIVVPLMLLFLLPPMFGVMNSTFAVIAKYIPTNAMMEIYFEFTGTPMGGQSLLWNFGVIAVWTVAALVAFILIYRKKQLDN